jgi:hypothetical protein
MPSGASSPRIASLSPSTANFVAQYKPHPGHAVKPLTELMFTMVPERRARCRPLGVSARGK